MSRSKRTAEEEIQHLKRKLRKLEAQETAVSITGEYKDRAPAAPRTENTTKTDSNDAIPSTAVVTVVQIKSPSVSRESQPKLEQSKSLDTITKNNPLEFLSVIDLDDHSLINDPQANLNASKARSSRSRSPANSNALDAPNSSAEARASLSRMRDYSSKNDRPENAMDAHSLRTEQQASLSRMRDHGAKNDRPENHNAMDAANSRTEPRPSLNRMRDHNATNDRLDNETHSSRNDPWTNCIDTEIHSSRRKHREYLNSVEANSSEAELQTNDQAMEVHTSILIEPQANLEAKNPKRKSRASLDTSEPSTSQTKPRTSSEDSHTDNTDNNILDRNEALLKALGDDLSLSGERIHPSLAQKWATILRRGLSNDVKDKLLKEYAAPENCKVLKAPILNDEVLAVVDFQARNRDKIMETKQNQLGLGITAIGRAITVLINQGDNYEVNAMRHFNHGCRILLDLHYVDTTTRKHLFKKDLGRSDVFRNLRIGDFERDETLFSTKIAKLVKKQGIPTTPMHQRPRNANFDANLARDGEPSRYRRM